MKNSIQKTNLALLLILLGLIPARASAAPFSFSVVNYNTWGVPFAVFDTFRYAEAMEAIEEISPDFVFLEEVFSRKGKKGFHSDLYPYEVNGPRAFPRLVSSGIRLLSKYPVLRSAKMAYRGCEKDDCLSKKGALFALIELPDGKKINLVGTHLNARGEDEVRMDQVDQLEAFIEYFADPGVPVLISGDFNYGAQSKAYPYGLRSMGVKDAWTELHALNDLGITYDTLHNDYAHDYCIRNHFPLGQDRIDYLYMKSAPRQSLRALESKIIFNQENLYSDHYGLSASFSLSDPGEPSRSPLTQNP